MPICRACQNAFDRWRHIYNHKRPHEALGLNPPATRYRPSLRTFAEALPPIVYGPGDSVRKVDVDGHISFKSRSIRVGKAFRKQSVALRPTSEDGLFDVHYCNHLIGQLNLKNIEASACGFVDIARAMPTTPQA
jgi:hypothetical protein